MWRGVTSLPDFKSKFPDWPPQSIESIVPELDPAGTNLLKVRNSLMYLFSLVYLLMQR